MSSTRNNTSYPEGRIIRAVAGFFDVDTGDGRVFRCKARGIFRSRGVKPLVGDRVTFEITHEGDAEGNVTDILPRINTLLRPPVANVDQALLLFAVTHPDPNLLLLDKFLVMMRHQDIPVIICFNKTDLDTEESCDKLADIYRGAGSEVLFCSVKTGEGVDTVVDRLRHKTSVLAGPSGVGKSSMLNYLYPEAAMETGELSKKIARGRNTTRHSELFHPVGSVFGGDECDTFLMDTPGFTSLDLRGIDAKTLHTHYTEFTDLSDGCAFSDCVHIGEPDCAVKDAVTDGLISAVRYDTYRLLHTELSGKREVYIKK